MGKVYSVDEKTLTDVIDIPRRVLNIGDEQKFPPSEFPDMIENALGYTEWRGRESGYTDGFESGYDSGYSEGTHNGIEVGRQEQRSECWNSIQHNGARVRYEYAFYRMGGRAFYPVYDIKPTSSMISFMQYFNNTGEGAIDVAERLEQCGVVLDTSSATSLYMAFYWTSGIKRLPRISLEGVTDASGYYSTFSNCTALETIDEIVFPESGEHPALTHTFASASALKNIKISGVIGKSIGLGGCPLVKASLESVMTHLSTTATGQTLTVSKVAVNKAFETSEGANDGSTSAEWLALRDARTNWTISFI